MQRVRVRRGLDTGGIQTPPRVERIRLSEGLRGLGRLLWFTVRHGLHAGRMRDHETQTAHVVVCDHCRVVLFVHADT